MIDFNHPLSPPLPVRPSYAASAVAPCRRIAVDHPSNVSRLALASHASTRVGAHRHFADDSRRPARISLVRWSSPCCTAHLPDTRPVIEPDDLPRAGLPPGSEPRPARTANSTVWDTWARRTRLPFREDDFGPSPSAAVRLIERGSKLIGRDGPAIGSLGSSNRETALTLPGNDGLILEMISLAAVAPRSPRLRCPPLRPPIRGGAPSRTVRSRAAS